MKITEFTDPLKTYMVTVRVVLKNGTSTARTSIRAESSNQAFLMLSRIYGVGNVQSISEHVMESTMPCQIQREAVISPLRTQTQRNGEKIALNEPVQSQQQSSRGRRLAARPVAEVTEATKTLSPQELQVKSLADKVKQATQQKKQLQARQALLKAQEKMRNANIAVASEQAHS